MEESPTVFVPAHITAFFEPHYDKNPLKSGSRGAGFCINLGSRVKAYVSRSRFQSIEIFINGKKSDAITTLTAVKNIRKRTFQSQDRHKARPSHLTRIRNERRWRLRRKFSLI